MSDSNKEVLRRANAEIVAGNHEGFLAHCAEDIVWNTVGDSRLQGKDTVRQWMKENYVEPPVFTVNEMIAEGDFVVALGEITAEDEDGNSTQNAYSDVWRFRDGKMAELNAYVVETGNPET
jgi:uncharacterized protein